MIGNLPSGLVEEDQQLAQRKSPHPNDVGL
jgi:hypothetical protein